MCPWINSILAHFNIRPKMVKDILISGITLTLEIFPLWKFGFSTSSGMDTGMVGLIGTCLIRMLFGGQENCFVI